MELTTLQAAVLFGVPALTTGMAIGVWSIRVAQGSLVEDMLAFIEELVAEVERQRQNVVQMGEASDRRVAELLAEGRFE